MEMENIREQRPVLVSVRTDSCLQKRKKKLRQSVLICMAMIDSLKRATISNAFGNCHDTRHII